MAEKYHQQPQQGYPLAPAAIVPRSDVEYATNYQSEEMRKKKRMKCFAYIAIFAVFQIIVITVFALTVMRVKTPKVRLEEVMVTNNGNGNIRLAARVLVKNNNFGRYKFESSLATIASGPNNVGQFVIPDTRARARSTKRIYVTADLNSLSGANAPGATATLSIEARLRGEVELMRVFEKKKTANMRCTVTVNLSTNAVQDVRCN